MERALPEAGLLRQFGDHFRMDQVRGKMEYRADQRQEYSSHSFFVVPRWSNGTHMLPGNSPYQTSNTSFKKAFLLKEFHVQLSDFSRTD